MSPHPAVLAAPLVLVLLNAAASAQLDANANGMSDVWERHYHGGALFDPQDPAHAPHADPDGDGWSNLQEATAGTDPFDPNPPAGHVAVHVSYLADQQEEPSPEFPDGRLVDLAILTWDTMPGKHYTLLVSPDPGETSWLPVGPPTVGTGLPDGQVITLTDAGGLVPGKLFWRIMVEDPLTDSDGDGLTDFDEFLLGSDPHAADTSGDRVPDFWLALHGFDPTAHHGAVLFHGSDHTVVSAFRMGVQAQVGASPDDFDADGVPNHRDADPHEATIQWRRGASPAWMIRYPEVAVADQFLALSPGGTLLYRSANFTTYSVFTPGLVERQVPADPPGAGTGFYGPFGMPLHGDRVFGHDLLTSDPFQTEWAYLDPQTNQITSAHIPSNNPPEHIYDATNLHVSGVGGGFGMRSDGTTPLFAGDAGFFESNDNAVSFGNGIRYWTYADGEYDNGREVSDSAALPGIGMSSSPSATVQIPDSPAGTTVHHLVPTSKGLHVAEGDGPFSITNWPAPLLARLNATRQGWILDHTYGHERLWLTGHWQPLKLLLPPRANDLATPEAIHIHQVRDTGLIAAGIRYPGGDWKHAVLTPIHLQIHHPQQDLTVPWNDYLPGYALDEPMLCKPKVQNELLSFGNLEFNGPQEIHLRFSGPAIKLADAIELEILEVTSHPGWAGNAGDSQEEDFSFSPSSNSRSATAPVTGGTASVPIHCKDYGAWARLRLVLKKEDAAIHPEPIILTLPHDANGDRIADHWQRGEIRLWNHQYRLNASHPDWVNSEDPDTWTAIFGSQGEEDAELADSDGPDGPMPAMADDGDGLTALEEYRGFFLDGGPATTSPRHRRLSVARKDLLVECSEMEGIASASLRLPSDANSNFIDQGNDPNAFAQAYSLTTTMSRISSFFAPEGAPVGNNPKYFPGAALDMWWVTDKLNDMGYVVYENGAMGSTHKYSGPYKDLQRPNDATRDRNGWLSIASDENLRDSNPESFRNLYGGNLQSNAGGQGVAVLGNYGNRNNQCAHFIKLAVQGRKGFKSANGNFYAKTGEAAREQDERHDDRATHQGAAIFVNSLSEEPDLVDQTAFEGRLEWCVAHELAHLFVGNDDDHFDGSGIVLSKTREDGLSKFVEDEIVNTKLRQRASINRDANGNPQP